MQIAELEAVRLAVTDEQRAWAERRMAILIDRRQTWRRARNEQAVLAAELSTIAELVRWMYEQSALGRSVDAQAEVADAINAAVNSGPVLRELAALDGCEPVDPEILRLGRRGQAENMAAAAQATSSQATITPSVVTPQALAC
jgi:hypothetical protein